MPRHGFNVGDRVTGVSESPYGITNQYWQGYVVELNDDEDESDDILVSSCTPEDYSRCSDNFWVNSEYFVLVDPAIKIKDNKEKIMKKNTLNARNSEIVNIPDSGTNAHFIVLVKLKSTEELMANGNSEKFSSIIGGKWVLVDTYSSNRVRNDMNPHIKGELNDKSIRNYRIDNFSRCYEGEFTRLLQYGRRYGNYYVDFVNGKSEVVLTKNETICPNCHNIVEKSAVKGHFCLKCLTDEEGLAYRFDYHGYHDGYATKETVKAGTALFGCEIERDWISRNGDDDFYINLENAMAKAVIALHPEIAKKKLKIKDIKRDNVFMYDGSLRNGGCEWITFPHTYKYYKKNKDLYQKALDIFKEHSFGNSSSVGNHIHINRDFFGKDAKFCAAKMALLFNEYWEEFKAIANRTDTSYSCKPHQEKKDDLFELIEKTVRYQGDHSAAVNLQHSATIECRLWGGIDNVEDLLLYLDLTYAIAKTAKKSLTFCQSAKITDILSNLQDKEHIQLCADRLRSKGKTTKAKEIEEFFAKKEEA